MNPRPGSKKITEKREKEFCVHFNNANADLPFNIRKNGPTQKRIKTSNSKRSWGSENQPENLPDNIESVEKTENAPPKRERKGWGAPRPNPLENQDQQGTSDEKRSTSPLKELQQNVSNYNTNNTNTSSDGISIRKTFEDKDEILRGSVENTVENKPEARESIENKEAKNIITSFKSLDIRKLRQQKKEEKLKKGIPEPEAAKDSPINRKISEVENLKKVVPEPEAPRDSPVNKKINEEEKSKKNVIEPEISKDSPTIKKLSAEKSKKVIREAKMPKDSPVNKKDNAKPPMDEEIDEQIEEEIVEEINDNPVELKDEIKKPVHRLDSSHGKNPTIKRVARPLTAHAHHGYHSNPNPKPVNLVFSGIPSKEKQAEAKKKLDSEKSITENIKPILIKLEKKQKPLQKEIILKKQNSQEKNMLIKRVESLDKESKKLLENILEKIESGSFDKEDLENLDSNL